MNKNLLPAIFFLCGSLNAQLVLTKNASEPIAGDAVGYTYYDTVTTVPRQTGTNQVWNFSSMRLTTNRYNEQYVDANSVPQVTAVFSGCDLTGGQAILDPNLANCYNKGQDKFEEIGFYGWITCSYSDALTLAEWPLAYGDNFGDTYLGTAMHYTNVGSGVTGTLSGTYNCSAVGTGTLILPEGYFFNDVLQINSVRTYSMHFNSPGWTDYHLEMVQHVYYHSTKKFPILKLLQFNTGAVKVVIHSEFAVGLGENQLQNEINIFPNPSDGLFEITLPNDYDGSWVLKLYDSTGKCIRLLSYGPHNDFIQLGGLGTGIYFLEVDLNGQRHTKKLVVE